MVTETILQHPIFLRFALPFFLVFFIVFAILQKTKLLGEGKAQIDALVSLVVGLLFVAFAYPTEVVQNMILFLTVAIVVMFVALLLFGFFVGADLKEKMFEGNVRWVVLGVVLVATTIAVLWATGVEGSVWDFLFRQSWSETFWINGIFIVVVAVALAITMKAKK